MSKNAEETLDNMNQIEFHYLKTNNYRSFHVDGAYGGITPNGNIYMELFLERAPTPKSVLHEFDEDGSLGKELSRQSKTGLIREVEAGLVLNLATAEAIEKWLAEKIEVLKSRASEKEHK